MAAPGKNSTAEYRTLVDGLIRGLNQLQDLASRIWDQTEEALRRHPSYRMYQCTLQMNDTASPLMSEELQALKDKNDSTIQELMPQ
jgi:hypothetical protein